MPAVELNAARLAADGDTLHSIAQSAWQAARACQSALGGTGGMAGDEESAEVFAQGQDGEPGYDEYARNVLTNVINAANTLKTLDAALVNTARADLVDEAALAAALRSGRLAGYAADTLSAETTHATWAGAGGSAEACPLLDPALVDRVVLTPHRAAQTVQAVDRMGAGALAAVLDVLAGRPPATLVPAPEGDPA